MKKFAVLALILSLALVLPAFAEAPEVVRIDWTDESEQAFADAGFSGTWYALEDIGCQIIIPDEYAQREVTEAEAANHAAFIFENPENGGEIAVLDTVLDGADDLVSLGALLAAQDPEAPVQYAVINGRPAIITGDGERDSADAIFDLGGRRFIRIMLSPFSQSNPLLSACITSIQFQDNFD